MKNVDVDPLDSHKIVEESATSYSCAWCKIHNCPCEDLGYTCRKVDLVKGHWDKDMNWIEESVEA